MNISETLAHYRLSAEDVLDLAGQIAADRFQRERRDPITSPECGAELFNSFLAGRAEEAFAVAFLDGQNCLIKLEILFRGTVKSASVYPRVVAERALRYGAAAVLVAHNHPSGNPDPSCSDVVITHRLSDALALLDVELLDHFVVGSGGAVSMMYKVKSNRKRSPKKKKAAKKAPRKAATKKPAEV